MVGKTLSIYWQHAKKYPKSLWGIGVLMPIGQFADDFLVPLLTSKILTDLAKSTGPIDLSVYLKPLAIILLVELTVNLFWRPFVKIVWRFEEAVMRDLYRTIFNHLMKMSYDFYANRFGGSLVSQTNKFVGSFERLADTLVWNVYKLIIAFVFTIILLIKPAPLYVLALSAFSLIFVVILAKVKRSERPYNERWAEADSRRTGQLADSITNILAIKAFARENLEAKLFANKANKSYKRSIETMHKTMFNELFTTTSQRFINVAAILVSLYLASQQKVEIGVVYLALIYTLSIMRRLWDLNNTFRNFNRVFGDAREMTEILNILPEVKDPSRPHKIAMHRGEIVFENVSFGYPNQSPLFKNFNLKIKPGEKIGLVGHSGGGKTTITKLLLRFVDIQAGKIMIDRQDISKVKQLDLRSKIAHVPQEPLMFHRSLMDNIRYGRLQASDKEVYAVSKMAHAHEFIESLPKKYATMVGERGTKLSGGQKQRVAIARAMIKHAPILVLDEATSALDSESEKLIQDALWRLMEGRTAIVIAHRLSTIQKMDRIVVLDNGKVAEQGTHKELLRNPGGIYRELWAHQSGGFLED